MKRLGIIGVGSAGIQSICHFLSWLDNSWQVVSIHDPNINVVGIGESTNPTFTTALERAINFNLHDDLVPLEATLKIGTVYKNWRKQDFVNPLISGSAAIHFNTFKLKDFALRRLHSQWGDKFVQVNGNISLLTENENEVIVTIDGQEHTFDYIIDCRGFPKDYTGYTVFEDAPVNHALVHNVQEKGDWLYTGHRATVDGWMFEIPLTTRQSFGYLFNDKITSVEQAKENFAREIGVAQLDNIEYKFKSYYSNNILSGRVIKNGNSAVFFEPLFANSLWLYNSINQIFFDYLNGNNTVEHVNKYFIHKANQVRDMICYTYHGGSTYETDFWKYTKEYATNVVKNSDNLNRSIRDLKRFEELKSWRSVEDPDWIFPPLNLMKIDRNFEYNYFTQ
jgi:hypothetical protein